MSIYDLPIGKIELSNIDLNRIFIPLKEHEVPKMRLQHIVTERQMELAKELKGKLINLQFTDAMNIIDYLNDEIIYFNKEKSCQ